ncbi:MAG: sensor histidine kinase [Cyclobacteriaceae bacterium]|jgi:two-component system LytT family sensor kinase
MLKDSRYWIYHGFVALIVSGLLAIEDLMELGIFFFDDLLVGVIGVFVLIIPLSYVIQKIVHQMNAFMPWSQDQFKRFFLESFLIILLVLIFTICATFLKGYFQEVEDNMDNDFGFEILALIMFFISIFMLAAFHEFMALNEHNESLYLKAKILEKQNYIAKYEALKSQVNPHFLFNSLNVLSSLIYTDPKRSDIFIKKFANVFRYVLELNNENLVKVEREIDFLNSYLFLQKIRYGDSLDVRIELSSQILASYIPPLSLQIVVENALKYSNSSLDEKISIYIEESEFDIVVRNSYDKPTQEIAGTGTGQKNLIEKYQLMGLTVPRFYIVNDFYVARLPVQSENRWNV